MKTLRKLLASLCSIVLYLNLSGTTCYAAKNLFFYREPKAMCMMALVLSHPEDENDIIIPCSINSKQLKQIKKVFNNVYIFHRKDKAEQLKKFSEVKDQYDRIFIHHTNYPYYKDFYLNKKTHKFEDGSTMYVQENLPNRENIEKTYSLFPAYRHNSWGNTPNMPIAREKYLKGIKLLFNPSTLKGKIFYCFDGPELFNYAQEEKIVNILKNYDDVVVKFHPRHHDHPIKLVPKKFTVLDDQRRPFESYYYGFNGIFISNLSTCLHTAKFMKPDAPVICTACLDGTTVEQRWIPYIEMLKKLGVMFPKTLAELKSMISQNISKI